MTKHPLIASALAAGVAALSLSGCAVGSAAEQTSASAANPAAARAAIDAAVAAPTRTPANLPRDRFRNPAATLSFFGVRPGETVVELWPGGGWYTEILAPLVLDNGGTLYAAELRYLVDHEFARTADDVLWRRSKLGLHLSAGDQRRVEGWFASNVTERALFV